MILNDIFTLPTSRPDLEVCTKFGTPGVFAGPIMCPAFCSVLFLSSDRSRHPPRPCCKALRFGFRLPSTSGMECTTAPRDAAAVAR